MRLRRAPVAAGHVRSCAPPFTSRTGGHLVAGHTAQRRRPGERSRCPAATRATRRGGDGRSLGWLAPAGAGSGPGDVQLIVRVPLARPVRGRSAPRGHCGGADLPGHRRRPRSHPAGLAGSQPRPCHHLAGRAAGARRWYAEAAQVSAVHHAAAAAGRGGARSSPPPAGSALMPNWRRPGGWRQPAICRPLATSSATRRPTPSGRGCERWNLNCGRTSRGWVIPAALRTVSRSWPNCGTASLWPARAEHAAALTEHDPRRLADVSGSPAERSAL